MKTTLNRVALGLVSASLLTTLYGCGGGSTTALPTQGSMTVTPSLGKFSTGTQVKLRKLDGSELSAGTIGTDGQSALLFSEYAGPVVVEVLGGTNVQYYDESTKQWENFGPGKILRAVMPKPLAQVGVTPLTNAAAIRLGGATGNFSGASAETITSANAKVLEIFKTVLGFTDLTDILLAPDPVDGSTGATLTLGKPEDRYALLLVALAKTGLNAAAVADALAADLKDDMLDGMDGTTATPVTAYAPGTIGKMYQDAASDWADDSGKLFIKNNPLKVTFPSAPVAAIITPVTPVTPVTQIPEVSKPSDVSLARAMFAELRTTLNAFFGNKLAFLNTQAARMHADLNANVAPEMSKLADRVATLNTTMSAFEDVKANPNDFSQTIDAMSMDFVLARKKGSLEAVSNGSGSFDYCLTNSIVPFTPSPAISKMTCFHAGKNSIDLERNIIKMVVYELTSTTAHQYSYTATRYNAPLTDTDTFIRFDNNASPVPTIPAGSGTVGKTVDGSGATTGFTLDGTLPPSATDAGDNPLTGVDTVKEISAARTNLTGNNYHYALSGSVSTTSLADSGKVVSLSIDDGSYFDQDETDPASLKLVKAKLLTTAQTIATKFTGSLEANSFMLDADGHKYQPTNIVFNGSISDISTTSNAKPILTGELAASVVDYDKYHSAAPESVTNYVQTTLTFTGTVQAPNRPLLTLELATVKTGPAMDSVTLEYSYDAKWIRGSGVIDSTNSANGKLLLSNQDGIEVTIDAVAKTGAVTKSGVLLASIRDNGMIDYIDGVTESLN